jgi:hypothetical protein
MTTRNVSLRFTALALSAVLLAMAMTGLACTPRPRSTLEGAKTIVDQFMLDRAEGRVQEAQAQLTEGARATFNTPGQPALDLEGREDKVRYYQQSETSPAAGRYVFVFRIHRVARESPYTVYWDETIQVVWQGGQYRVDGASLTPGREAAVDEDLAVNVRRSHLVDPTGSVEGQILSFGMADLPDEFRPQGAPEDLVFGVGKEGYVLLSFSPAGDRLAFVTWGTHGFLGSVTVPEGRLSGIDLHFEGVTVDVEWAPDGPNLAAVIDEPTGNQALTLYAVEPPQRLGLSLRDHFAPEEFSVFGPRWQGLRRLVFQVRAAEGGATEREGTWQLDLDTGTVSRPAP